MSTDTFVTMCSIHFFIYYRTFYKLYMQQFIIPQRTIDNLWQYLCGTGLIICHKTIHNTLMTHLS